MSTVKRCVAMVVGADPRATDHGLRGNGQDQAGSANRGLVARKCHQGDHLEGAQLRKRAYHLEGFWPAGFSKRRGSCEASETEKDGFLPADATGLPAAVGVVLSLPGDRIVLHLERVWG